MCIPYPIVFPFPSVTENFILFLITNLPSTTLLCHPPSPPFSALPLLSPSILPHSKPILLSLYNFLQPRSPSLLLPFQIHISSTSTSTLNSQPLLSQTLLFVISLPFSTYLVNLYLQCCGGGNSVTLSAIQQCGGIW